MGVSAAKEKKEEEKRQQQQRQEQSPLNNRKMNNASPESEGAAPPPFFSSSRCDEISNEKNKANTAQYDDTLGNVDNNGENIEKEKNNLRQNDDLSMSKRVLINPLQNMDLNSPADIAKLKEYAIIKVKEGYMPIFLRFDQKPYFYFVKPTRNLKSLLKSHLELNGVTDFGEKYTFQNNGIKLDENTSINKLNLGPFSIIDAFK